MLLNELQKEHAVVSAQQDELQTQLQQIKAQQQQMQAQSQEIDGLRLQLQQQNASLQQRLSNLESYVATQTQIKTASDLQPAIIASPNGDSQ
jgi:predicted nuclease with TOPRIM domain